MDRRDFFTVTAGSAVTLASSSNVDARTPTLGPADVGEPTVVDVEAYVARLDQGMERIAKWRSQGRAPADAPSHEDTDHLVQGALQSLFVTGMLGDLSVTQQLDARVQVRVERAAPVIGETVDAMTAYLASRTEADLRRTASFLRQPGAARSLHDALEREAAATGVSGPRRRQMREMLEHCSWRLAHQPPALIVREYLDKVDRAADSDLESEARQNAIAARVGEELFWRQGILKGPRQRRQERGLRTVGIGFIVFAASGGLVAAGAFPFVFGMTVGVVMMIIGLLILLSAPFVPATPPGRDSLPK